MSQRCASKRRTCGAPRWSRMGGNPWAGRFMGVLRGGAANSRALNDSGHYRRAGRRVVNAMYRRGRSTLKIGECAAYVGAALRETARRARQAPHLAGVAARDLTSRIGLLVGRARRLRFGQVGAGDALRSDAVSIFRASNARLIDCRAWSLTRASTWRARCSPRCGRRDRKRRQRPALPDASPPIDHADLARPRRRNADLRPTG